MNDILTAESPIAAVAADRMKYFAWCPPACFDELATLHFYEKNTERRDIMNRAYFAAKHTQLPEH